MINFHFYMHYLLNLLLSLPVNYNILNICTIDNCRIITVIALKPGLYHLSILLRLFLATKIILYVVVKTLSKYNETTYNFNGLCCSDHHLSLNSLNISKICYIISHYNWVYFIKYIWQEVVSVFL